MRLFVFSNDLKSPVASIGYRLTVRLLDICIKSTSLFFMCLWKILYSCEGNMLIWDQLSSIVIFYQYKSLYCATFLNPPRKCWKFKIFHFLLKIVMLYLQILAKRLLCCDSVLSIYIKILSYTHSNCKTLEFLYSFFRLLDWKISSIWKLKRHIKFNILFIK